MRLFEANHDVQQASLVALKADLEQGMADLKAGHVVASDMSVIKAQDRALKRSPWMIYSLRFASSMFCSFDVR